MDEAKPKKVRAGGKACLAVVTELKGTRKELMLPEEMAVSEDPLSLKPCHLVCSHAWLQETRLGLCQKQLLIENKELAN